MKNNNWMDAARALESSKRQVMREAEQKIQEVMKEAKRYCRRLDKATAYVVKLFGQGQQVVKEGHKLIKDLEKQKKTKAQKPRRKMRVSKTHRANLKQHGRYMGVIRMLKAAEKEEVKAIRAEHGVRAAIKKAVEFRKAG